MSVAWGEARNHPLASAILLVIRARLLPGRLKKPALRAFDRLGGVCDVERNGLKVRCHLGDNTTERWIALKPRREKEELSAIMAGLSPGDTFIDVGANCGWFTINAARAVGPMGRVVAIEPLPVMLERLRFNVTANGLGNVEVIPVAVGEQGGSLTIHVNLRNRGQSSAVVVAWKGVAVDVPVRTLASIVTDLGLSRVDALKIDIEGYEDRVLLPMVRTLPRALWPRRILMETRHADCWREQCVEELIEVGYRVSWHSEHDVLLALEEDAK